MKEFSVQTKSGHVIIGIGLNNNDINRIKIGEPVIIDLSKTGINFTYRNNDGEQVTAPAELCHLAIIPGDTLHDIGEFLGVSMNNIESVISSESC